ncbi:hypothetical protein [Microbacterium sp.]|uniref:hypothetical protein n=1 Tax=Microbacterium sp. TaxID=51671 RepID=UPI0039E60788
MATIGRTAHIRKSGRAWLCGLSLFVVVALTGCGSVEPDAATASATTSPAHAAAAGLEPSVAGLQRLMRDITFDYNIMYSNAELAEISDSVVMGEVVGAADGPTYGAAGDALSDFGSVLIEVKATETIKGERPDGGSAHVLMYAPVGVDAALWNESLPQGTPVVVYSTVSRLSDAHDRFGPIDASVGVPAGTDVYTPAVQGFAVRLADGTIYWPLTGVTRSGDLKDALPGGPAVGNLLPGEEEAPRE